MRSIYRGIGWVMDQLLDLADFLARNVPQMKHEGKSEHFPLEELPTPSQQLKLWD